ncbi:MAG TPA: HAD family phosphatase [Chthoniobacterales bacterium]|nr:HAD family phosphatase [Chthoniobacterales bacterium]
MMIEALIFDIGNVLVPFDWKPAESLFRRYSGNFSGDAEKAFRELIRRLDLGELTGEEFASLGMRTIGFTQSASEFVGIWNSIFNDNPPMARVVLGLKKQFPLFLISNISDLHHAYLTGKYGVFQHFLDGVYSYRAKCAKPDRRIFEMAITQFGVNPEKTVFVDDLPANVESASRVGFRSVQYDFRKHIEFERRLALLRIEVAETV